MVGNVFYTAYFLDFLQLGKFVHKVIQFFCVMHINRQKGRCVGGAIVDNDQFDIGMALLQHVFYGRADKALVIVGRDDDGNQGALHGWLHLGGKPACPA